MPQIVYEGMFIFDPNRYAKDAAGVSSRLAETITKCGGELLVSRLWDERRLAYQIAGQRKGTYWLTYFKLDTTKAALLRREVQLNDDVLRSMVLKINPRLVDALVEHARSGAAAPKPVEQIRAAAAAERAKPEPVAAAVEALAAAER